MYFKPRIFVSSLMKNKLQLRKEISSILTNHGFDVLLYEKNLTPSSDTYTYRKDILHSDFVIFIIDEKYGTITPSGYSGVEEEFKIVNDKNIKFHVYIKNTTDQIDQKEQEFIDKISSKGISYFLFNDEKELKKRISESVTTISKDISLSKIDVDDLDEKTNLLLSFKHDYLITIDMLGFVEELNKISNSYNIDLIETDILFPLEYLNKWFSDEIRFNDCKLTELFTDFFEICIKILNEISIDYTADSEVWEVELPIYGRYSIHRSIQCNKSLDHSKKYQNLLKELGNKFSKIKDYIKERKYYFDIY